jgi:hypothetical protein
VTVGLCLSIILFDSFSYLSLLRTYFENLDVLLSDAGASHSAKKFLFLVHSPGVGGGFAWSFFSFLFNFCSLFFLCFRVDVADLLSKVGIVIIIITMMMMMMMTTIRIRIQV